MARVGMIGSGQARLDLAKFGSVEGLAMTEIKKPAEHVPGTPYSPNELIVKWGYSRPSVIRLIKAEPGVLKLRLGPKGTRTCYSVPEDVERRIWRRLSGEPDPPQLRRLA